jgi:hypothetical protein
MERFEHLMTAVAFAEEGEHESARRLGGETTSTSTSSRTSRPTSGRTLGLLAPRPSHP